MIRDKNNTETTVHHRSTNNSTDLKWTSYAPKKWKMGTLQTVRRVYDIFSTNEHLQNELCHFLLLQYKGKRADNVIKSMKKTIHKLLPETVNTQITYTGRKLSTYFQIKDKINLITSMTWCIIQSALVSYVTKIM